MLTGILVAIIGIALILFARSITTLIHELGHAIPSLLFTKEPVAICVGSYENLNKSKGIKLGRLTLFFTLNIFNWNQGLCLHKGVTTFVQNLLIIIGGPFASLLVGLGLIYIVRTAGLGEYGITVVMFLLVSAIWDFLVNIIPQTRPLVTHHGQIVYNDGYQLQLLLQQQGLSNQQQAAMEQFRAKNYTAALEILKEDIPTKLKTVGIQQVYVESLLHSGAVADAEEQFYHFFGKKNLDSTDFSLIGAIKMEQNEYANAIQAYDRAIYLDYQNPLLLNQKGLCHSNMADYEAAIVAFSKSLLYNPDYYDAFLNRAYVLIKLKKLDLAAKDLQKAAAINSNHPKTYFHIGLLKKAEGDNPEALKNLQKAQDMGFKHHGLDYYISEVRGLRE